jgi:DNA repair protein RadD
MLRDYQQRAINQLYSWFEINSQGNPCLVLPTGSGKSHIVAALCKDALQSWPNTRILMLTHVKELIEQNAEKMRLHWKGAPLGIYSASIGKKELGEPITFAGIQSVHKKANQIGHIDLVIIDECHLVNHRDEGGYRKFLADLKAINPFIRIVGLTATPYRLGHGLITDKPALFDDLIEPVGIEELIYKGHLAILRSKVTKVKLDTSGVHKRGGEFIESELQAAVDTKDNNEQVVREVIALADQRKAWLFFCTGVNHAQHIKEVLIDCGVSAECVTGDTPKKDRELILEDFKAGKIKALTNANVLTTGFDYPDIDLIAMLRPTMSPSLYVQMAGRGMRPKSHTDHCLVLDFAGVIQTHGPITNVQTPKKGGSGDGEAPIKVCDSCGELVHISATSCPACGEFFPEPVKKQMVLHNDDIMGMQGNEMVIKSWTWKKHISRTSGKEMIAVTYYGDLSDPSITEYFSIFHGGYAGQKALQNLIKIAFDSGLPYGEIRSKTLDDMIASMNSSNQPAAINFIKDGKYYRVLKRSWK